VAALDLRNSVHTGIVVAVGNGMITTVEGDSNNAVRKHDPFDSTMSEDGHLGSLLVRQP
jgi:hypothetical protein